jgi:hypothetical protein
MPDTPKIREEVINSALAELLSKKVGEWLALALGESVISLPPKGKKLPDVYFVEYYGVKIAFEAKIGLSNIRSAVEKAKERVKEGLADLCFAVAYDERVTDVERIEKVEERLLMTPLRLVVVSATSLDGIDLGEVKIEELESILEKHRIYDLLVLKEATLEVANKLKDVLDSVSQIPIDLLNNIAALAERELKIVRKPPIEEEEE